MITISTLLYEGNYRSVLAEEGWFLNYDSDLVSKKLIAVNNVKDRKFIHELLQRTGKYHSKIEFFFVEDLESECIQFFNLNIDKKATQGYYYIIPYFALTLHVNDGFFFHVSEDCSRDIRFSNEYIEASVKEIATNDKILVTTIGWGFPKQSHGYDVGEWEQIETFRLKNKTEPENNNFWHSVGFVDQIFIANANKLKSVNYNIETYDNPIYHGPWYCPNSWERRVAEYMYKNDLYRGVWKKSEDYYIHPGHTL